MKFRKFLGVLAVMAAACSVFGTAETVSAEPVDRVVYLDSADGQTVTLPAVLDAVADKQVIFFGEYHDSQPVHVAERSALEGLYARYGTRLVLSMEMFERDVQPVLDDYLAGRISEADFLAQSRPWPNHQEAYRPLLLFVKAHHIPVLAANIPRRMAAVVAKTGTLADVRPEDRRYAPRGIYPGSLAYRRKFIQTVSQVRMPGMSANAEHLHRMYRSQCLKDDTMARTMADYLQAHPETVILHVNGGFHSDGGQGVPWKLDVFRPGTRQAILSTVHYRPGRDSLKMVWQNKRQEGDFLVLESAHRDP